MKMMPWTETTFTESFKEVEKNGTEAFDQSVAVATNEEHQVALLEARVADDGDVYKGIWQRYQ